jgi:transposase InsO family protein
MITIDFITKLPPTQLSGEFYDTVLTTTDKVSREVVFSGGKETWTAAEWADVLLRDVVRRWGLPLSIISDRGSVFVSELWKAIFLKLDVSLLFSTAYHPQTDGQSEATNKYLQTMLRFFVNERQDDWGKYLGEAEFLINNSTTTAMKMSPNEVLFGFKLRSNISALGQNLAPHENPLSAPALRSLARADAEDASKHAAFHIAKNYNRKHEEASFKVGDRVYLRLGKGYKLRGIPKAKLGLQRVGPFPILEKVGGLAYKLQLPDDWRIHPVISVAQLELAKTDPFDRTTSPPPPVEVDGEEQWEIETVIRAENRGRGRNRRKHYLVRWRGFGPEVDSWVPADEMEHAAELVQEFERREEDRMNVAIAG